MKIRLVDQVIQNNEPNEWAGCYGFIPSDDPPYRTLRREIQIVRDIPAWLKLVVLVHECGHLLIDMVGTGFKWKPFIRLLMHACYDDIWFGNWARAKECLTILALYPSYECRGDASDFPREDDSRAEGSDS